MRILVTGCARSGTTLMANLLATCFGGAYYPGGEAFPPMPPPGYMAGVGKLPSEALRTEELVASHEDLVVLYMVRDPVAVLISRHPKKPSVRWVTPERWISTARVALALRERRPPRVMEVFFETLVASAATVQGDIQTLLALPIRRAFDDAVPHFTDHPGNYVMGDHRALDADRAYPSVSPDDAHYLRRVWAVHPEIGKCARALGYSLRTPDVW